MKNYLLITKKANCNKGYFSLDVIFNAMTIQKNLN